MTALTLQGFGPSVYTRVIRLVLAEKALEYRYEEIDPFEDEPASALSWHPFGRVPVLDHDGFRLYESAAIARYLDAAFPARSLVLTEPQAAGRMSQVIGIVDAYGYRPLVRQVFAQRVYAPAHGLVGDEAEIALGLDAAGPVLDAFEAIAVEGLVLTGARATLADCHLAPMIAAFAAAPEGSAALAARPALRSWWRHWAARPSMRATDAGFDTPPVVGA